MTLALSRRFNNAANPFDDLVPPCRAKQATLQAGLTSATEKRGLRHSPVRIACIRRAAAALYQGSCYYDLKGAGTPMKMIIAHLPNSAFETLRTELGDIGVLRMAVAQVYSTSPRPSVTLRYRGTPMPTHLRAEMRLECVVTDGQSSALIDVLHGHAGQDGQIAVLDLEELHQKGWAEEDVISDDPRLDAAVL